MRWPVEVVLDMVASGMGIDEILADHPELEREDIVACLQYAADHQGWRLPEHTFLEWYACPRSTTYADIGSGITPHEVR